MTNGPVPGAGTRPGPPGPPGVEILRVDPRLLDTVASLFWATFPGRRLGRLATDADGRVPLTTDAPWVAPAAERWRTALDTLLQHPSTRSGGAYLREVRDRAGRRVEVALPVAPGDYGGGAWLVGPFFDERAADAWASRVLLPPWVHDVHEHGDAWFADVFVGDPDR